MVGVNTTLSEIPKLNASNSSLDINLITIAKKNNGTVITCVHVYITCVLDFKTHLPKLIYI